MSAPLAVATRNTSARIPWWRPSNHRIWIMKLPSSPTYATARMVPAILAMVRPGFSNWRLCTTKLIMSTATKHRNGQAST